MCEPATLAAIGTTVMSAAGTAVATAPTWAPIATAGLTAIGNAQEMRQGASTRDAQASNETAAAAERAARLKAQGMKVLAEQRLQYLSSGVEGGSGSALEVGAADAAELETDALTELFGGQQRAISLRKEAKNLRSGARLQLAMAAGAAATLGTMPQWGALGGGGVGGGPAGIGRIARAFTG